ncbi:MAG: ABC-2 family transporter protein, partial [Spirochaetia bacterium]|nr:ABC-2 family transporter protein [Spirochaetia bacterium]
MEYRASFVMFVLTMLGFYGAQVAVIGLMLNRFKDIGGWNPGQIAFLYGLLVLSQGIVAASFAGLIEFSDFVRQGTFDRLLLRPLSPLVQALAMRFEPGGIANIALGIAAFVVAQTMVDIQWNFIRIVFFLLTIVGASCILAAIRIIIAALAFITVSTEGLQHLFVFSSREFLLYPLDIFSKPVRVLLTFFFPLAFINFYPAHYFLNKDSVFLFHPMFVFMTLPVGLLMMFLAGLLWKAGVS